ncbi:MAG: polyprenol monophosphomannose synthase [Planctomyces sp.]|nr:polyprenol monophosphomannose synthase [Planctomyces sp.]
MLVSLCTYNERGNVVSLIPEILRLLPDANIVVIDDNSPDGTGQAVEELRASDPRVHLVSRPGKLGLGTATIAAFRFAIAGGYDFLLNLDADFSHPPRHIPELLRAAADADVVIGSRYVPGGATPGWSWRRRFMSWCINTYSRLMLGLRLRDLSGAFRCYRVSRLRQLDLDRIRARGYAVQEEILYRCKRIGCTFVETPITFEERRYGTTKINAREAAAALWTLARLPWERG